MKTNKKGFTLIELLVVVAIIGLLSTLAVVALSSARKKANDSKRLSDMKQIQTALELYYTDNNLYPVQALPANLGQGNYLCLDSDGFDATCAIDPYMGLIPTGPGTTEYYIYTSADGSTYTVTSELEVGSGNFGLGDVTASPSGIIGQPKT
ncbi:MAG: prepilin-type N-terminal cleavage/methylation domain-containing protein [Candidatus Magasanikbacteria bacterium]